MEGYKELLSRRSDGSNVKSDIKKGKCFARVGSLQPENERAIIEF